LSTSTSLPRTQIVLDTPSAVLSWLAEALFVSTFRFIAGTETNADQIRDAVRTSLRQLGSEEVRDQAAAEYGDYPEVSPARMAACLRAVTAAYSPREVERLQIGGAR
jgi:hypothetical protein